MVPQKTFLSQTQADACVENTNKMHNSFRIVVILPVFYFLTEIVQKYENCNLLKKKKKEEKQTKNSKKVWDNVKIYFHSGC